MNYFLIDDVAQIITARGNDLYFFGNDHALKRYALDRREVVWSTHVDSQYLMLEDSEFVYPYSEYSLLYKLAKGDGKVVCRLEEKFCPLKFVDGAFYGEFGKNNEYWLAKIDAASFAIEKQLKLGDKKLILIGDGKGLLQKDHDLACMSMDPGTILWELDLNVYRKTVVSIMLFIGYARGHALFNVSGGIIGVSLDTGSVTWSFMSEAWKTHPILDEQGILCLLVSEHPRYVFYRIDTGTGGYLLQKELPDNWNEMHSYRFTAPAIYGRFFAITSAQRLARAPYHSVVLFDLQSGDLLHSIKLEGTNESVLNAPHFTDDLLLQLDGEGRVHVIENYSAP